MTVESAVRPYVGEHAVRFYSTDAVLVEMIVGYIGAALRDGDVGLVIATMPHRDAIERALHSEGLDTRQALADGRLILLDAAATLDQLTADCLFDPGRFDSVVGTVVRAATSGGRSVRAYGEMVAVLWEAGDVAGALQLEGFWNQLREQVPFSLLCGYETQLVQDADQADAFSQVCAAHSHVVAGAPAPVGAEASRRFVGTAYGPRLARQFVLEVLDEWDCGVLVDDVLLVTSELATNAVRYCGSDFTVSLSRREQGVTVVVGDGSTIPPCPRYSTGWETGGRGLQLVDGSTERWGHRAVGSGKLVWAHIVAVGGENALG